MLFCMISRAHRHISGLTVTSEIWRRKETQRIDYSILDAMWSLVTDEMNEMVASDQVNSETWKPRWASELLASSLS